MTASQHDHLQQSRTVPLRPAPLYSSGSSIVVGQYHGSLLEGLWLMVPSASHYRPRLSPSQFGSSHAVQSVAPSPPAAARQTPRGWQEEIGLMVRQLLASERVLAARKLINSVPADQLDEPLRRLRSVLAEPEVRRRIASWPTLSADLDWLRRNALAYRGKWVAVSDGTLLDADESLEILLTRVRRLGPAVVPFVHHL